MSAAAYSYAVRLSEDVDRAAGGALAGAYLHGSAVLGGWVAERSDVDVLFVAADDTGPGAVARIGDVLAAGAAGCPGRGLECSVVRAAQARRPGPPWPFLLHVGAGPHGPRLVAGDGHPGDPDLLMHYVVCRGAGAAVLGPPPAEVIGVVSRTEVLAYLAAELGWGLTSATENYAVLNACRALVYLHEGRIVSKVAGGLAALETGYGPPDLISAALDQQQGTAPERPPGQPSRRATAFVGGVAAELTEAAAPPPRPPA